MALGKAENVIDGKDPNVASELPIRPRRLDERAVVITSAAVVIVAIFLISLFVGRTGGGAQPDNTAASPEPAAAASQSGAPEQAASPGPTSVEAQVFKNEAQRFSGVIAPCDRAMDGLEKVVRSGDVYSAYSEAQAAENLCSAASDAIAKFTWEGIGEARQATMQKSMPPCADAYRQRSYQLDTASEVFNGDSSPKKVNEFKILRDLADQATTTCVTGMVSAAAAAGFDWAKSFLPSDPAGAAGGG